MERAAFAHFALHPDAAAHQLDKPGADCETEARAPVLARGRAVGLGKGLKDYPLLLRRDADTCVSDGEVKHNLACRPRFDPGADNDVAPFGELDRVTHQVDDVHKPAQVELDLLKVELPRLDLREIQDVVDHGQKGIG